MLRLTFDRLSPTIAPENIVVVTSSSLADATRRELPELPPSNVIGEPVGRNSAPAVALAARWVGERDPKGVFVVAPADHIVDRSAFWTALEEAGACAAGGTDLVTFGIHPTRPETGYGYIELGESRGGTCHRAAAFHEKPDRNRAVRFLESGRFRWNSGMFVWRADTLRAAFAEHAPALHALSERLDLPGVDGGGNLEWFYEHAPSISIDYAVMEKARNVVVCTSPFAWCDVGSWAVLPEVVPADASGNVYHGPVLALDCEGSVVFSDGGPVALIGVRDLIVVRVGEVTMVCPRERAGEVRELVRAAGADPAWRRFV
jgi:mannose-1-phosphate guanylyltransferase